MIKKNGVSLIILVITIIVMIILAAAIIISLNNTGIIGEANKATIKQNLNNYKTELKGSLDDKITQSYTNMRNYLDNAIS